MPYGTKFTKSYILPIGDLSLNDRQTMRAQADSVIVRQVLDKAIVSDESQVVVRDCLPNVDLGITGARDSWIDTNASVADVEHNFFNQNPVSQQQVIAFFGVAPETTPMVFSKLRFTLGGGAVRGVFQLESLYSRLEPAGYFGEPIVYVRTEVATCKVTPRAAAAANSVIFPLLARTGEPIGNVISAPSV